MDPSNSVNASISTTKESITIKAERGVYIPTDATIVIGDNVETSGMGGIYKKGIHIGKIVDVVETKNIVDRYIIIEPSVNFNELKTVLVIIE